jgi:arylformamidase
MLMSAWLDISVPIRPGMVHWPGDPPYCVERVSDMRRGDVANVSLLKLGAHTGTHIDAPLHFVRDGLAIDAAPFDALIGRATVIHIEDRESIKPGELQRHKLERGQRVLLKTRNSPGSWEKGRFVEDFVHIRADAAQYLVDRGVRTIGVDYLSVGGYERDGVQTHQVLLGAGLWLIEGLNLSAVEPGEYEMVCLPLKLEGVEASPARAVLRRIA